MHRDGYLPIHFSHRAETRNVGGSLWWAFHLNRLRLVILEARPLNIISMVDLLCAYWWAWILAHLGQTHLLTSADNVIYELLVDNSQFILGFYDILGMASERSRMVNGLNGNYLDKMGIIRDHLIQSLFIGCKEARRDFIWLFWHFLPQWRSKNNLKFIDQNGFVLYLTFWARWGWQIFVSQNFWIFRKAKPKIRNGIRIVWRIGRF